MKIVYPICCGLDVHKKIVVATIASTDDKSITTYQCRQFTTFNCDLIKLRTWLVENNCQNVCMESTGKYWIPIFNVLEIKIKNVVLAHPKYTKAIKGKKTDKKDSKWIADLFKHGLIPTSFIPSSDIRKMRELSRYRFKLTYMKVSEKNRIQNCMTMSNIRIDSVVSDPFGKTASSIMQDILSSESYEPEQCLPHLQKGLKKKSEEMMQALEGVNVGFDQKVKMTVAYDHIAKLDNYIAQTEDALRQIAEQYSSEIYLLCTIPGIKERSALAILSEIGVDMSQFTSAKHLASWAGLSPTNNESAGKKKSVRISHAGCYLKPILVQVVLCSIKDQSNNYYATKYNTIKKRRGHKKAIIAVARMIMVSIYNILLTGELFNPYDLESVTSRSKRKLNDNESSISDVDVKNQFAYSSEEQALLYLKSLGYDTTKLVKS